MVISIYVFSFWGLHHQTPTRALPLDPTGGLLSSVPLFCPSPKQITGYAPRPVLLIVVFPNVPTAPGQPCTGEDREFNPLCCFDESTLCSKL